MILYKDINCCGCATCAMVCPVDAISLNIDDSGFVFPIVDSDKCTNCNLCNSVCPFINHENAVDLNHDAFAAYAKDSVNRFKGSSGGIFGLLAKQTIDEQGVVYGAAFDQNLQLKCTEAKTLDELSYLYKSKYLQSDLGNSFEEIKNKLKSGTKVLFVSTPCQVSALRLFLKKEYENLLTVDFVCHGVPSQELFNKCKEYVEKTKGIKILDYSFRAKKKNGATPHYYKIKYVKNSKIKEDIKLYLDDPFYLGFQKYITLRDSCYSCKFALSKRCSDITIGDFHEIDKYIKGINRFDGVSTVVVNTEKGRDWWSKISNNTIYYSVDFGRLIKNREMMCGPTEKPKNRDKFIEDLKSLPFNEVVQKYFNTKKEMKKKVYYSLPKMLRKVFKKVMVK